MKGLKRRIMRVLSVIAFAYVLLVVAVYVFQRGLIYFPTSLTVATAESSAAGAGFTPFRNSANEIIGWKLAPTNEATGTVLIFHGNAGCALDRDYLAAPICRALPLEVIIVEYPGYGARNGSPNLPSILATAEAALSLVPANRPVYLVSESIGAGAAAHLAGKFPGRISGLAMFVPYDDLGDVAQNAFPFLPAKWLLRDRFLPAQWLQQYHGPVQIVLAGADEIIPTKRGQSLHDHYAGPKRLQIIPGARHNDVSGQAPQWWQEVFAFLNPHRTGPEGK